MSATLTSRAAIQAAINALPNGGEIVLPPQEIVLDGALSIRDGPVTLRGSGYDENISNSSGTRLRGSGRLIDVRGTAARGLVIRDMAIMQNMPEPVEGTPYNPAWQDYAIRVWGTQGGVTIDNVFFPVVQRGIFLYEAGRSILRCVRGYALDNMIKIDRAFDVTRLEHIHQWAGWWRPDLTTVKAAQRSRLNMIELGRVDGLFADDIFNFNGNTMFYLYDMGSGITRHYMVGKAYADFTRYGVYSIQSGAVGRFQHLVFQGEDFAVGNGTLIQDSSAVFMTNGGQMSIGKLHVDRAGSCLTILNGPGNLLEIDSLSADVWGTSWPENAAIHTAPASITRVGSALGVADWETRAKNQGGGQLIMPVPQIIY